MDEPESHDPATAIALAWQPRTSRAAFAALFALDRRLGAAIARAKEPMLAQVRLAWWRERLAEAPAMRPVSEPLLAELTTEWGGATAGLVGLVDGWEHLVGDAPLPDGAMDGFAEGRGAALANFASLAGYPQHGRAASAAGRCWAFAELASGGPSVAERAQALALGRQEQARSTLPRALRGVAVLGGLSRRALTRDEPLMAGRGAALTAIRLGMFGG